MSDTPLTSKELEWDLITRIKADIIANCFENREWSAETEDHCATLDLLSEALEALKAARVENKEIRTALELAREVIRIKSTAPEQSTRQAPIAAIRVGEESSELLHLYAPGLPSGEHDLYCEPVAQPPKTGNADELCNAQTQRPRETVPEAALPAPTSPADPLTIPDLLRKPDARAAATDSGEICARMPEKIEDKSCLYGGSKHCPYFNKRHPCCDCGATTEEGSHG